jgi:hypothetical protein
MRSWCTPKNKRALRACAFGNEGVCHHSEHEIFKWVCQWQTHHEEVPASLVYGDDDDDD